MRTKCCLVFLLLLGVRANTACEGIRQSQKPEAVDYTKKLRQDLDTLSERMRTLRRQVLQLQLGASRYESPSLVATEKGYSRIDTTSGFFLVSVKDVKPYLDGYGVILLIGNPTTARYDGFNRDTLRILVAEDNAVNRAHQATAGKTWSHRAGCQR